MEPPNTLHTLHPNFISSALNMDKIEHRFVLVMESESKKNDDYDGEYEYEKDINNKLELLSNQPKHRFSINGHKGTLDPRKIQVSDLLEYDQNNVIVTSADKVRLHNFIYVIRSNTDEHGWQYRTNWNEKTSNEPWSEVQGDHHNVRRRMWLSTEVYKKDENKAHQALSRYIKSKPRGKIFDGDCYLQESGIFGKKWVKRYAEIKDNIISFHDIDNGNKVRDYDFSDHSVNILIGLQTRGRDFPFSIRPKQNNNNVEGILLDVEHSELRRRWVVAIEYQLAMSSATLNFPIFLYGPDQSIDALLLCGDLEKRGHIRKNFLPRFFKLTRKQLEYYHDEELKGKISISGSTIIDIKSTEGFLFEIISSLGDNLLIRANNQKNKDIWVKTIQQILDSESKNRNKGLIGKSNVSTDTFLNSKNSLNLSSDTNTLDFCKSHIDGSDIIISEFETLTRFSEVNNYPPNTNEITIERPIQNANSSFNKKSNVNTSKVADIDTEVVTSNYDSNKSNNDIVEDIVLTIINEEDEGENDNEFEDIVLEIEPNFEEIIVNDTIINQATEQYDETQMKLLNLSENFLDINANALGTEIKELLSNSELNNDTVLTPNSTELQTQIQELKNNAMFSQETQQLEVESFIHEHNNYKYYEGEVLDAEKQQECAFEEYRINMEQSVAADKEVLKRNAEYLAKLDEQESIEKVLFENTDDSKNDELKFSLAYSVVVLEKAIKDEEDAKIFGNIKRHELRKSKENLHNCDVLVARKREDFKQFQDKLNENEISSNNINNNNDDIHDVVVEINVNIETFTQEEQVEEEEDEEQQQQQDSTKQESWEFIEDSTSHDEVNIIFENIHKTNQQKEQVSILEINNNNNNNNDIHNTKQQKEQVPLLVEEVNNINIAESQKIETIHKPKLNFEEIIEKNIKAGKEMKYSKDNNEGKQFKDGCEVLTHIVSQRRGSVIQQRKIIEDQINNNKLILESTPKVPGRKINFNEKKNNVLTQSDINKDV